MFSEQLLFFLLGFLIGGIFFAIIILVFFNKKQNTKNLVDVEDFRKLENEIREAIKKVYTEEGSSSSLLKQVVTLGNTSNTEIATLKKTLTTGGSHTQGQWGQTTCENILKELGFKKGREYEAQKGYLDENGNVIIPDFIIKLPEDRHYILDSKVSIKDWYEYVNATDEQLKNQAFKKHVSSVVQHIKELRNAKYENLRDIDSGKKLNTGEFILMYMPIENSFQSLSEVSSKIREEAFKNNITIVGPSLLHLALRIVDQMWSINKQTKNTTEAIHIATNIYNKASNIISSFDQVEKSITTAKKNIETASKQLSSGNGNFISLVNKFKDTLGIISTKQIKDENNNENEER
tara:strand:+ start:174 stop:1220 length:1047 start_codon:yes stop_codon:yes gene_type:complete